MLITEVTSQEDTSRVIGGFAGAAEIAEKSGRATVEELGRCRGGAGLPSPGWAGGCFGSKGCGRGRGRAMTVELPILDGARR
jgi:hypothetical protein